jgi:hypothetical protein
VTVLHLTPGEAEEKRFLIVLRSLLRQVNQVCRREGNPNLTLDDLPEIPDECPLLGLELRRSPYSFNIDESYWVEAIEPELGHVKGNLWIISYKAHRLRKNGDL